MITTSVWSAGDWARMTDDHYFGLVGRRLGEDDLGQFNYPFLS